MKRPQAEEEAKLFLASINNVTLADETALTLISFVESVYLARAERQIRPSTLRSYRVEWNAQLKPYCVNLWIRKVRTSHLQDILDSMAATQCFNKASLQRIKSLMSRIFKLAIQRDFYSGANPATTISIPDARRASETYAYSLSAVLAMINAVPEPTATVLAVAAFTGCRRGEIRGMRWEDYRNGEMMISQSVWNGISTDPKTEASKAPIPIIGWLQSRLEAHRQRLGNPKTWSAVPQWSRETNGPEQPSRPSDSSSVEGIQHSVARLACMPSRPWNQSSRNGD